MNTKRYMKVRIFVITVYSLVAGAVPDVGAAVLSVLNPSFEDLAGPPNTPHFDASGRLRDGHFSGIAPVGNPNEFVTSDPIPSWNVTGNDVGTQNPAASVFPSIPEGQNTVYIGGSIGGGTISQTLPFSLAIGTYSLRIDVGNPGTVSFAGYNIQLLGGSSILAEDNNTLTPATGLFLTSTLTYIAPAGDPNLGRPLTIRLAAINPARSLQTNFDNVRLTGPIPEPASVAMLGTGAIWLLGSHCWRRRRAIVA